MVSAGPGAAEAESVLEHIEPGTDLIVPLAVGEPRTLLDVVEAAADAGARISGRRTECRSRCGTSLK